MTLHELVRKIFPHLTPSAGEVKINCPFCPERVSKADSKSRLGINTLTGTGHCFRCEKAWSKKAKGGRAFWFRELCRVNNLKETFTDDADANEVVKEDGRDGGDVRKHTQSVRLPPEYERFDRNTDDPIAVRAIRYLRKRGVTDEQVEMHEVGFCAVGRYAWRLVFPVRSPKGRLQAFVARSFDPGQERRYLNSEGAKGLYNLQPRKHRTEICCLAEGIFDVLSFERAGVREHRTNSPVQAIAGLGKSLTRKQVRILRRFREVVIWTDPDGPGIEGTIKRAKAIAKKGTRQNKTQVSIVMPLPDIERDGDLGSLKPDEIRRRFRNRVPYNHHIAATLRARASALAKPLKRRARGNRYVFPQI